MSPRNQANTKRTHQAQKEQTRPSKSDAPGGLLWSLCCNLYLFSSPEVCDLQKSNNQQAEECVAPKVKPGISWLTRAPSSYFIDPSPSDDIDRPPPGSTVRVDRSRRRVLIIGGSFSGLAAGRDLGSHYLVAWPYWGRFRVM